MRKARLQLHWCLLCAGICLLLFMVIATVVRVRSSRLSLSQIHETLSRKGWGSRMGTHGGLYTSPSGVVWTTLEGEATFSLAEYQRREVQLDRSRRSYWCRRIRGTNPAVTAGVTSVILTNPETVSGRVILLDADTSGLSVEQLDSIETELVSALIEHLPDEAKPLD